MPKKVIKKVAVKDAVKRTVKKPTKKAVTKTVKKPAGGHVCRITKNDPAREQRIDYEIVVDAYDSYERTIGWYCSLEDTIENKARCRCRKTRSMSPLTVGDEVDVLEMAPQDDCESEMFVFVQWNDRRLAVPLEQLEPISGDPKAIEMIEDWLYWCLMGYEF
jgi:hypothetical protein